jgi:hypothetical protein
LNLGLQTETERREKFTRCEEREQMGLMIEKENKAEKS